MHVREQWWLHCASQWGQLTPLREHVYCVAITFKMTECVEQWICIRFCVKLEHSSMETIQLFGWFRRPQLWATGNWHLPHGNILLINHMCRILWWNNKSPRWFCPPYSPDLSPGEFWLFPKLITFEREEVSDHLWDSEKYNGAADGD